MATTTANVSIVMRQILKAAIRQIDSSKFKVNLLKDEYQLVKRTSSGMRAAMNILRGDPDKKYFFCLLYTSPSPRDGATSRMPSSA